MWLVSSNLKFKGHSHINCPKNVLKLSLLESETNQDLIVIIWNIYEMIKKQKKQKKKLGAFSKVIISIQLYLHINYFNNCSFSALL